MTVWKRIKGRRTTGTGPTARGRGEVESLARAVDELRFLNELALEIGGSRDTRDVIQKVISRSMKAVGAEEAVVTLLDRRSADPMKTYARTMATSLDRQPYRFEQSILGWMHINRKPLVVKDIRSDVRFEGVRWEEGITSLVCVPLMVQADMIGVLTVYNKRAGEFTEEDKRLLAIIAGQSAQVIENARLYEEEKVLMRMREELNLAARIQMELLPKTAPGIDGFELAGTSLPAQVVGGDYFDYIEMQEGMLGFCLGDVSGKGLPAAILMANLQATLRGQTMSCSSPGECLRRSNRLLYHSTDPEKFATLFCGVLRVDDSEVRYANAGHEPPFVIGPGADVNRLHSGGLVLGVMEEFDFGEETLRLEEGSVLAVFSDGVLDAVNELDQPFGEERLERILVEAREESAGGIVDKVVAAVRKHSGDVPQTDDITMLVLKKT